MNKVPILLVLVIVLSACGGGGGADPATSGTLDERMSRYETSLREEFDWLWENMNYARSHAWADEAHCEDKTFQHYPVTLDDPGREADPTAGLLVDHLDYAAALLQQAREEWDKHCATDVSAVDTVAFLESRLTAANKSLGIVQETLTLRARTAATG